MFDYEKYKLNRNKKIIQIGQQLRKMTSIYRVEIPNEFIKIWLTGTKNYAKCERLLEQELKFLNMEKKELNNDVEMKYVEISEYDELISNNIVFIDLFDASANNTVLECIIRNTPIIVNKISAIKEYLGEKYPLFFENLSEVKNILENNELIFEGHRYLKSLNKEEFKMEYFNKKIIQISRDVVFNLK
jgi:hypothetical protein